MTAELQAGLIVADRYVIQRTLGEGGMGTVYLAHDRDDMGRQVAVKVLNPKMVGRFDREQRFANEVNFSAVGGRLPRHPNLASTLNYGRCSAAGPFFVMEYIDGPALGGLRFERGEALDVEEILRLAYGVAFGLVQVHEAGLVHRDLTPANVLVPIVDGVPVPKIIDLSHAASVTGPKLCPGQPGRLTSPHEAPGTPGYMAPEQVSHSYPDPAMDIFAFGVVFWELLADRVAFEARDRRPYCALQVREPQGPPSLVSVRPELPTKVYRLIDACVAVDPQARPTARDVVAELNQYAPVGSSAIRVPTRTASRAPVDESLSDGGASKSSRLRLLLAVIALVLLAALVVGVWANIAWQVPVDVSERSAAPVSVPTVTNGDGPGSLVDEPAEDHRLEAPSPASVAVQSEGEGPSQHAPPPSSPLPASELEPEPEPKPKPKPTAAGRQRAQRRAVDCAKALTEADKAANQRRWKDVLVFTKPTRCRAKSADLVWRRAQALLETKRYKECAALNYSGDHRFARRTIKLCARALSQTETPTSP